MRILFVEDHRLFVETVVEQFLSEHQVTAVPSIAEALGNIGVAPVADRTFDAILVDHDLGDGKGDTLVRSLRENGYAGTIVAVSSHEHGNRRLLDAGASSVCRKSDFHCIADHLHGDRAHA